MFKKYLSQQQGITLIELLATLAISSLFIGLTFSVLTSTLKFNDKTQSHINLRQEANILITNIRKHHQNRDQFCYEQLDQLLMNAQIANSKMMLDGNEFKAGDCWGPINANSDLPDLQVAFTLTNSSQSDTFKMDTIIEGMKKNEISLTIPQTPSPEDPYEDWKSHNIFVYGSDFGIYGSTPVDNSKNNLGTIFITNLNNKNLYFTGNNVVSVSNIYINKKGKEVIFTSSTKLGKKNITDIVRIEGNVQLNNGAARIDANTVYIDGNVTFGDSAIIEAKKVIITGDVTFKNWSAYLKGNEIYIGGKVTKNQPNNVGHYVAGLDKLNKDNIPKAPQLSNPSFRDDMWYSKNGYEVRTNGHIANGSKIFSPSHFTASDWHPDRNNVIIISKGDIDIKNFGGSQLTGILFAPQGKVTFNGGAFKGIVIARDGFFTGSNPSITFTNVAEFIKNPDLASFK